MRRGGSKESMDLAPRGNLRLVGDVGGTNVRFALVDLAQAQPRLADPQSFLCADFPTLEAAIDRYLGGRQAAHPDSAVIAVAGPVLKGKAHLTNGLWDMSEAQLAAHGLKDARLINDYAALAYAVRRLGKDDLGAIGGLSPSPAGTALIIGAGTGLGVSAMVRDGDRWAASVTEGGHVAFAPTDDTEVEILRRLTARFGRVSIERILSGPGLANLRWALGAMAGVDAEPLKPEEIVARARDGSEALCAETLARFCAIYGSVAGDFALAYGATGGVFLGGGIAPRILDELRGGEFRRRFEAKGRFSAYTGAISTQVITHPYAALLGGAEALPAGRGAEAAAARG